MFNAADLPDIDCPIFPLPGALLLPRARLPLHIFEPRYLAMLDDTMKSGHRLIGMIQPAARPGARARQQWRFLSGFRTCRNMRFRVCGSFSTRTPPAATPLP
jgi:Lon protease-like protein